MTSCGRNYLEPDQPPLLVGRRRPVLSRGDNYFIRADAQHARIGVAFAPKPRLVKRRFPCAVHAGKHNERRLSPFRMHHASRAHAVFDAKRNRIALYRNQPLLAFWPTEERQAKRRRKRPSCILRRAAAGRNGFLRKMPHARNANRPTRTRAFLTTDSSVSDRKPRPLAKPTSAQPL